jgi:hypothetical protein
MELEGLTEGPARLQLIHMLTFDTPLQYVLALCPSKRLNRWRPKPLITCNVSKPARGDGQLDHGVTKWPNV